MIRKLNKMRFLTIFSIINVCTAYKPVILLHGILTGSESMDIIKNRIEEVLLDEYGEVCSNIIPIFNLILSETSWNCRLQFKPIQRLVKFGEHVAPGRRIR